MSAILGGEGWMVGGDLVGTEHSVPWVVYHGSGWRAGVPRNIVRGRGSLRSRSPWAGANCV
jgi:hypothetical protein